jgi:hypothetical protein
MPSFMTMDSGIQVTLRSLHEQFERTRWWLVLTRFREVRHWGGLSGHEVHTKLHDDRFRRSNVVQRDIRVYTHTQQVDLLSLLLLFQNKEIRLKTGSLQNICLQSSNCICKWNCNGAYCYVFSARCSWNKRICYWSCLSFRVYKRFATRQLRDSF